MLQWDRQLLDVTATDPRPQLLHLHSADRTDGLCDYPQAMALLDELVARSPDRPDVLLLLEHPPVATLGRSGGEESLLGRQWRDARYPDAPPLELELYRVARGGKITMHGPGQLVIYPVVQLAQLQGPVGRGPLGDLPAFVRLLEHAMQETCQHFGLETVTRPGFSGVWLDEERKLASIGLGLRRGWSLHGLALNVDPPLDLFELMVPCGLQGARLTSMGQALRALGRRVPAVGEVAADLAERLRERLVRTGGGEGN